MTRRTGKRSTTADTENGGLAWMLGAPGHAEGYFAQSRSLALSFVLIAPVLLVYEFALIHYPPVQDRKAGQFLRDILTSVFQGRAGMALNLAVLLLLLLAIIVLAGRGRLHLGLVFPMVLESAGWAALLVGIGICCRLALNGHAENVTEEVIRSMGAGVYEEILFRLLLTSLLYLVGLRLFRKRSGDAAVFAVVLGALAFALCHRPGHPIYLLFHFSSGVVFSGLYIWRGLGVAVYTHVIYNVIVVLAGNLRPPGGWPFP